MKKKAAAVSLCLIFLLTACAPAPVADTGGEIQLQEEASVETSGTTAEISSKEDAVPDKDTAPKEPQENPHFFPSGRTFASFYCVEPETEQPQEVNVLINEMKRLDGGVLYELQADYAEKPEECFPAECGSLCPGYFYVTGDKIYLVQEQATNIFETEDELLAGSRIVCQEENRETVDEDGWSETLLNMDGSTHDDGERTYSGYIYAEGKKYSESFRWKRNVGLTGYTCSIDGEEIFSLTRPIDYETAEEKYGILERNICKDIHSYTEDEWLCSQEEIIRGIEEGEEYNEMCEEYAEMYGGGYDFPYCTYDFNDDGMKEYIVIFNGSPWSGSAGSKMIILERTDEGGSRVIFQITARILAGSNYRPGNDHWLPIAVLDEQIGGYHSFLLPDVKNGLVQRFDMEQGKYDLVWDD